MAILRTRAYIGRDNWTRTRWRRKGKDAVGNDVEEYVKFETVVTDVHLIIRDSATPPVEVTTFKKSEHPESFQGDDLGNLYVRQGEIVAMTPGTNYQVRLVVFDAENPDGLVFADYAEITGTDTYVIQAL